MKSPGPYQLVNGTQVAANYAALTDGAIDHPRDRTETGARNDQHPFCVWTHTLPNGTADTGDRHCTNWTAASDSGDGDTGLSVFTDGQWSDTTTDTACDIALRLYCFQQR